MEFNQEAFAIALASIFLGIAIAVTVEFVF